MQFFSDDIWKPVGLAIYRRTWAREQWSGTVVCTLPTPEFWKRWYFCTISTWWYLNKCKDAKFPHTLALMHTFALSKFIKFWSPIKIQEPNEQNPPVHEQASYLFVDSVHSSKLLTVSITYVFLETKFLVWVVKCTTKKISTDIVFTFMLLLIWHMHIVPIKSIIIGPAPPVRPVRP